MTGDTTSPIPGKTELCRRRHQIASSKNPALARKSCLFGLEQPMVEQVLSVAAVCLALSAAFVISTWAILIGLAGIVLAIEEIRNWWRPQP